MKERQEENAEALGSMDQATQKAGEQWAKYARRIEETQSVLEKMNGTSEETAQRKQQLQEKVDKARAAMEQLEQETNGAAKTAGELIQQSKELADELEKQEEYAAAVQRGVYNLEKQQASAKIKAAELASQIELNNEYLQEAQESSDGCATSIDRFGNRVKKSGDAVEESVDALTAMSDALAAAGLVNGLKALADAMWDCSEASMEMESAIAGVYKTVDGTPEQLAEISDGIKAMSTKLPTAATEIAAVAETAGQLGIQTDDILSFTKVMVDLGESTNLSAQEGAEALAKLANITGMSADNYDRLGSVIVGLGNNFATTEADIVSMATRLAATGSLTGLTEAQIMALATAMSSVGIEAEAGGSAVSKLLKQFETMVATGSDSLDEFASVAGMSAEEFSAAWGEDAVGALTAFLKGLGKIDAQGGSSVATLEDLEIKETNLSRAVLSMASSGDLLTRAVDEANRAWAENTALTEEASKRYETAESKLAMLSNSAYNFQAAVGDVLNQALVPLYEEGAKAFAWMTDVVESAPEAVAAVASMTTTMAGLTAGMMALGAAKKALAADGILSAAIGALTNPTFLAVGAVAALTAGVATYVSSATEASEASKAMAQRTKDMADVVEQSTKEFQNGREEAAKTTAGYQEMAQQLEELAGKEDKQASDLELIHSLVDQLNQAVPNLNLNYEETTGSLTHMGETAVYTAEELERMLELQAKQDEYNSLVERQVDLYNQKLELDAALKDAQE